MPADPSRTRELDLLGDNFVSSLSIPRLTLTRPGRDENGWDYFIEFPPNQQSFTPLDEQAPPIKCLVQLKTTDDFTSRSLSMKLSNWQRLVKTTLPAFVLIVDFRGNDTPQETFLCHIGEDRIASALKRIREAEAQGATSLHKAWLSLRADDREEIPSPTPSTFIEAINKYTGANLAAYGAMKARWCDTVGFEDDRYVFRFSTDVTPSEFVDASLGLRPLQISEFTVSSKRFGIEIETTKAASGTLHIESKPSVECRVTALSQAGRASVRAMAAVPLSFSSDPEYFKIILHCTFLRFTVSSEGCSVALDFNSKEKYEVEQLLEFCEFICICLGQKVELQFKKQEKIFARSNISDLFEYDAFYFALRHRLRVISQFAQRMRGLNLPQVSVGEVMDRGLDLKLPALVVSPRGQTVSYSFDWQHSAQADRQGIFAVPVPFALGSLEVVAFCYWTSTVLFKHDKVIASLDECVVWEWRVLDQDFREFFDDTVIEFEKFCRALRPNGAVLFQNVELVASDSSPEGV